MAVHAEVLHEFKPFLEEESDRYVAARDGHVRELHAIFSKSIQ